LWDFFYPLMSALPDII